MHLSGKRYRFLFLVGHGRDGSTLLQSQLNSSKEVLIRGENVAGIQIASTMGVLEKNIHRQRARGETKNHLTADDPWFGVGEISVESVSKKFRKTVIEDVIRPRSNSKLIGFKEIRWFDLDHTLHGNQILFPEAKYIFLERDPVEMKKSGWWPNISNAKAEISKRQNISKEASQELGNKALNLEYERLVSDSSVRAELEEFLSIKLSEENWQAGLTKLLRHHGGNPPWEILWNPRVNTP